MPSRPDKLGDREIGRPRRVSVRSAHLNQRIRARRGRGTAILGLSLGHDQRHGHRARKSRGPFLLLLPRLPNRIRHNGRGARRSLAGCDSASAAIRRLTLECLHGRQKWAYALVILKSSAAGCGTMISTLRYAVAWGVVMVAFLIVVVTEFVTTLVKGNGAKMVEKSTEKSRENETQPKPKSIRRFDSARNHLSVVNILLGMGIHLGLGALLQP